MLALMVVVFVVLFFGYYKYRVSKNKNQQDTSTIAPKEVTLPDFVTLNSETGEMQVTIKFEESTNDFGAFLVFDIETTGLPKIKGAKPEDFSNWPRVVQISWLLLDADFRAVNSETHYLKQDQSIPPEATKIHKIDDTVIAEKGEEPKIVFERFLTDLKRTSFIVAHNIDFDAPIVESEFLRLGIKKPFKFLKKLCTMKAGTSFCSIPKPYGYGYKYPTLSELFHQCYFSQFNRIEIEKLHDAQADTMITAKCFQELKKQGCFQRLENQNQ